MVFGWIKENTPSCMRPFLRRIYGKLYNVYRYIDDHYTNLYVKYGRVRRNKIVFDNFFGKGYGDNPKYIAEEIHRQGLDWDMVWLLGDTSVELPAYIRPVQYGSNQAKRELASAKVVVNNVRNSMRMTKKKGQIYLQTWHGGLGFKKVEGEAEDNLSPNYVECAKRDGDECDAIISSCALQSDVFRKYFWLNPNTEILEVGQPRCDAMFMHDCQAVVKKVRKTLDISEDSAIILYAPTFRDDGSIDGYALDFEKILNAFERTLSQKCVMIIRLHPNVQNLCSFINYYDRIINGSAHPDIQELYLAASALITDYSSAAFDFSLLNKPVFICALDYDEYQQERGLTEAYKLCPFPKSRSDRELLQDIDDFSQEEYTQRLEKFKKDIWKPFDDSHAAQRTVEWLKKHI